MFKIKTRVRPKDPVPTPSKSTGKGQSKRRSVRAHKAILMAAADVASERGFQAATIEQIAARAGTGKQTIYRWWGTKPRLYLEVYEHLVRAERLHADTGRAVRDLTEILASLFEIYRTTPAAAILAGLIAQSQSDDVLAAALRERLIEGRSAILATPIRRGQARGEIDACADVGAMVDMIVSGVWYRLLVRGGDLDRHYAVRLISAAAGLAPEDGAQM